MTDRNAELQRRLTAYGRNFGITRLDYAKTGQGWWVRLGWRDRNPAFSAVVADARHGGVRAALREARKIRDRAFLDLLESGDISPHSATEPRPFRTRMNKTGVAGMSRQKTASKTGAGWFWSWKVNWSENRKMRGRSFADSTYGGPLESFRVAAEFRMVTEFRLYGFSLIDPDGIDDLYQKHFGLKRPSPSSDADLDYITVYNTGDYRGARVVLPILGEDVTGRERYFSVTKHNGDLGQAIQAAREWRDRQGKKLYGEGWEAISRKMFPRDLEQARSNTGHIGVTRMRKSFHGDIVVALWRVGPPGERRTRRRQFSINKYGEEEAIRRAVEARDRGLQEDLAAPWRKTLDLAAKTPPPLRRTPNGWAFWHEAREHEFREEDYRKTREGAALFWAWLDAAGTLAELEIQKQGFPSFSTRIFDSLPLARILFESALDEEEI